MLIQQNGCVKSQWQQTGMNASEVGKALWKISLGIVVTLKFVLYHSLAWSYMGLVQVD